MSIVAGLAITPTGRERLEAMAPLTEPARVGAAQAATTEGVRFLSMAPGFPLRAPSELEVILDGLDVEGRALEPLNLLGLADYLESIEATRRVIASTAEPYSVLKRLVEAIASFGLEIAAVRRKIEPSGEVADHASPALASIRERLRRHLSDAVDPCLDAAVWRQSADTILVPIEAGLFECCALRGVANERCCTASS